MHSLSVASDNECSQRKQRDADARVLVFLTVAFPARSTGEPARDPALNLFWFSHRNALVVACRCSGEWMELIPPMSFSRLDIHTGSLRWYIVLFCATH